MKSSWFLTLLCSAAAAIEPADMQGLRLQRDVMHEPVMVDGVAMRIQRVQGPDAAALAARITDRWGNAGPVQRQQAGGWELASRWNGGLAEVVQWRGRGAEAELLYSRLDPGQRAPRAAAPFRLPSACQWGRSVSGRAAGGQYLQQSAVCRGGAATLLRDLARAAQGQGWQVSAGPGDVLRLQRQASSGMAWLAPGRQPDEQWLIWIGAQGAPGVRP